MDSKGVERTEFSTFCPECLNDKINVSDFGPANFDEQGWHQSKHFRCMNPKCNHTWAERAVLIPGSAGHLHKYA